MDDQPAHTYPEKVFVASSFCVHNAYTLYTVYVYTEYILYVYII